MNSPLKVCTPVIKKPLIHRTYAKAKSQYFKILPLTPALSQKARESLVSPLSLGEGWGEVFA